MNKFHSDQKLTSGQALLSKSTILQAEGADAQTFLQGQFSQDISKLTNHEACFAGLSNPKGRLIVTAYIYKKSHDIFWLVLPTSMLPETQKQLTKYVMRSKVKFSLRDDLHLYGLWNSDSENLNKLVDTFKLAEHANLVIGISENVIVSDLDNETNWTLQKILNVIPEVNPDTQEHFVAQMLNMDVLEGISFNKGCYTGQEVIARMQHLGRVKRRTLLIESQHELLLGEKLQYESSSIGEIFSCMPHKEKFYCLAVMQLDKIKKIDTDLMLESIGITIFEPHYKLEQVV